MKDTTEPPKTNPPSIHLNWQDWLPYFEASTASEAEKQQVIETVWSIVMVFVDLGWDIDTGENTSGKSLDLTTTLQAAVLNSQDPNDKEQEAI